MKRRPQAPPAERLGSWRVAALCVLAACSSGDPPAGPARYERLSLASTGELETPGLSVLARFDVGPEGAAWQTQDETPVARMHPEYDVRVLSMRGPQHRVRLAELARYGGFNQVAVELVVQGQEDVRLSAVDLAGEALEAPELNIRGRGLFRTLVFDLAACAGVRELELEFRGTGTVELASISLWNRPAALSFGEPEGRAALVSIAGEARLVSRLTPGDALQSSWSSEPVRLVDELSVVCGVPAAACAPAPPSSLRAIVSAPDGTRRETLLPLTPAPSSAVPGAPATEGHPAAWCRHQLALEDFVGQPIRVRFELDAAQGRAVAVGEPALARRAPNPTTVMLVTSDTHRADHLGASGAGTGVETPFLDELAQRGALFSDCLTPINCTNPSHASLLTGVHVRDIAIVDNYQPLAEEARTLAEAFRAAGFVTLAAVSARHLAPENSGLGQGFDRMSAPLDEQRSCSATIAALQPWLEETRDLPRFVWLHVFDAHAPYTPPEAFERLYYSAQLDPYDPELPEPEAHQVPRWARGVRDLDYLAALYKSEVSYLDAQLAGLLERPGCASSLLAVTSDHGESLAGPHNFFTHKALLHETLHVPLVLVGPGIPAGARVRRGVRLQDLGRTLLDLADLGAQPFPGTNMLNDPGHATEPRFALATAGLSASVQVADAFLLLHLKRHAHRLGSPVVTPHAVELYDLASDPTCTRELSAERHADAARLRRLLVQWLVDVQDLGWASEAGVQDKAALAALAELGYAAPDETPTGEAWIDADCGCSECQRFE